MRTPLPPPDDLLNVAYRSFASAESEAYGDPLTAPIDHNPRMEPQIQYCTTTDDASLAYATMGAGPLVIMPPSVHSFAARLRAIPSMSTLCAAIAATFTLVLYDGRGMGLSERERHEYDLEGRIRDLEAVIGAIGGDRFALLGQTYGGFVAMAYAARHPERVTSLVLVDALSDGRRYFTENPVGRVNAALQTVTTEQWEYVSEAIATRAVPPGAGPEAVRDLGAVLRETWTPDDFLAHRQALREIDVKGELAAIQAPTLVISAAAAYGAALFDHSRELATSIPNARLVRVTPHWSGWDERDYATLIAFFGAGAPSVSVQPNLPSGTAIIMFADIVDSTALTEKLGDAAFRDRARALDTALRGIIAGNGGAVIDAKTLGDGVLATFPSASDAIAASLAFEAAATSADLQLHVGLHAGDVIREANNVFGGAVNIAARISAISAPGEVLVSRTVADLARTSAVAEFEDRGEHTLKGIEDPQRLFAVQPRA